MATTTVNVNVSAAGTDGQIQFNNSGAFGADSLLVWDNTNKRLGVGGTAASRLTIQGTATSDSGQLGAELLTTGTGTNWTGTDFATGYTHVTGSTADLTSTLAAVVNNYYQITYTVTGRTAGSFTIAFGGFTSTALTATGAVGPRATTTGTVVITPTSDFDGTIVLSIRVISTSAASVTFNSSTGTLTNEIRISSLNSNTFIGRLAGSRNTTGTNNTANGVAALQNNTTGGNNTALGRDALQNNTTGSSNTANGVQALQNNTTGSSNTANGVNALQNNTTGNNNTALGVSAGRFITGGATANTITNNSVFLGVDSRAAADNQTNQIVIGHQATGLGSNTAVIGNSSTTLFRPFGNVAIGADTAGARLDVRAQGALSTDIAFRVRNSANNSDIISLQGDGGLYGRMVANTQWWQMASASGVHRWELGFTGNLPFIAVGGQDNTPRMAHKAVTDNREYAFGVTGPRANMALGASFAQGTIKPNEANSNTFYVFNGTAPTLSATDSFSMYSADIVAGNAAPHFRTENGNIIKIYQETTAITAATFVANTSAIVDDTATYGGYTMGQVVAALKAQGLLA